MELWGDASPKNLESRGTTEHAVFYSIEIIGGSKKIIEGEWTVLILTGGRCVASMSLTALLTFACCAW